MTAESTKAGRDYSPEPNAVASEKSDGKLNFDFGIYPHRLA
ncbi:MAG: hypothetical protein ACRD82_13680 [Blastocatellia bacterium]